MNTKNIIGISLGITIIILAFFTAFGFDALSRLIVDDDIQASVSTDIPLSHESTDAAMEKQNSTTLSVSPKPVSSSSSGTVTPSGYTLTSISGHNSATSCYSAINGQVYDLTDWVDRHPGGRMAILMICGKDGSALFNSQHGSSHRVANLLAQFQIGTLE